MFKKAKKTHIADNSTAIDVAKSLNAAMGLIPVQNSLDMASGSGGVGELIEVENQTHANEYLIHGTEESGSGEPIQIDEPTISEPEVTMVNQDDNAAPAPSSSDSGTGGVTFDVH